MATIEQVNVIKSLPATPERDALLASLATPKGGKDADGLSKAVASLPATSYSVVAEMAVGHGFPRNFSEGTAGQRGTGIVKALSLPAQAVVFSKGKVEEALLLKAKGEKAYPKGFAASITSLVEAGDRHPEVVSFFILIQGAKLL